MHRQSKPVRSGQTLGFMPTPDLSHLVIAGSTFPSASAGLNASLPPMLAGTRAPAVDDALATIAERKMITGRLCFVQTSE
jgi:hypothetical protein